MGIKIKQLDINGLRGVKEQLILPLNEKSILLYGDSGTGLKLNISENDNSLDFDLALEVIEYFRLDEKKALDIIKHIKSVVSTWRSVANSYYISKTEQELMAKAFRI